MCGGEFVWGKGASVTLLFFFFFKRSAPPRVLPSSPPRRSPDLVSGATCQPCVFRPADVHRHRHARGQQSGKIKEGIDPVGPASHKAVEVAKRLFAPHIKTDRKSTRLNSSHLVISYAVFCLKKKT